MSKGKKLLNEDTVKRFMKLAGTEKLYESVKLEEEELEEAEELEETEKLEEQPVTAAAEDEDEDTDAGGDHVESDDSDAEHDADEDTHVADGADDTEDVDEVVPPHPDAPVVRAYQAQLVDALWQVTALLKRTRSAKGEKYTASLQFKAPLDQVVNFVHKLETQKPWIRVTGMRIGIDNADQPMLSLTLSLEATIL